MKHKIVLGSLALVGLASLATWVFAQDPEPSPTVARLDDGGAPEIDISRQALDVACNGTSLAAWATKSDSEASRIFARWIGNQGPIGAQFAVTDDAFDFDALRLSPHVYVFDSVFRVAWSLEGSLAWRDYDSTTFAPGPVVSVALPAGVEPLALDISTDGRVAVMWAEPDNSVFSVQAFAGDGTVIAADFPVATHIDVPLDRNGTDLVWLDDGNLLTQWSHYASFGDPLRGTTSGHGWSIRTQRFDVSGAAIANEVSIFAGTRTIFPLLEGYENDGAVAAALPDGGFVVVHGRYGSINYSDTSRGFVVAKTFDSADTPSEEIEVRGIPAFNDTIQRVDTDPEGGFLVVWQEDRFSSPRPMFARRFDNAGSAAPAVELPSETGGQVADGHATVFGTAGTTAGTVWVEDTDPSGLVEHALFYRRLQLPTLLNDGFDSGNTGRWCRSVGSAP